MLVLYSFFACGYEQENYDLVADYDRDGFSIKEGDCDDRNPYIYPHAAEICDSLDNNCDDITDSDLDIFPSYYVDNDGDGYGNTIVEVDDCKIPFGYSLEGGDCDDNDSGVHPNATVHWDNVFFDEDCDNIVQSTVKISHSNWGVSEQRALIVVSDENDIQPISISKQSIHFLNFPSGQENSIQLLGMELTSFAIGTENGNIAVFAQELLGDDQGILLYDIEEIRQNNNQVTNYWHGSIGFLSLPGIEVTDLEEVGDFVGNGNMFAVAAQTNDFHYMMFYEELGQILFENPQYWSQSMQWDQGEVVVSENDIANLGEHVWSLGDVNGDGYDDIIVQMYGSDILHLIKGSITPRMSYPYWTLQSELGCQPQVRNSKGGESVIFCNQDEQTFVFVDYQYGGSADMMSAEIQFSKEVDDLFYIESDEWSDDYFAVVYNEQLLFHQRQSGKFQELQQVGYSFTSPITSNIVPIPYQREGTDSSSVISMLLANNNSIFWLDSPPLR